MRERNFLKPCLTKELLHMFKLWCVWSIDKEYELEGFFMKMSCCFHHYGKLLTSAQLLMADFRKRENEVLVGH